ncbi:MAG TPA: GNAT family N-acetyltransferase [Thermoanaerobaculia bacterium]|nr:GNAT family N-acetyltransferase [Thermoanaerobaculia bacterium]
MRNPVAIDKVLDPVSRTAALAVLEQVYLQEKRWIRDVESEIPTVFDELAPRSWYVATIGGEPAGAIRLAYDPDLALPADYGVTLEPGIDLDRLRAAGRFVDIGRFMIVPRHRRNVRIALQLMQAAIAEVVERGYTHFLTDVFESDPHSPLGFHTRVLGFERIGTHRRGELACESVRVLLILDIARAYRRLKVRGNRIFRQVASGLDEARLAPAPSGSEACVVG